MRIIGVYSRDVTPVASIESGIRNENIINDIRIVIIGVGCHRDFCSVVADYSFFVISGRVFF